MSLNFSQKLRDSRVAAPNKERQSTAHTLFHKIDSLAFGAVEQGLLLRASHFCKFIVRSTGGEVCLTVVC